MICVQLACQCAAVEPLGNCIRHGCWFAKYQGVEHTAYEMLMSRREPQGTFLRQGPQLQHSEQPSPQPPRQGGHTQQPDACACRTSSPCRLRRHMPLRRTAQSRGFGKDAVCEQEGMAVQEKTTNMDRPTPIYTRNREACGDVKLCTRPPPSHKSSTVVTVQGLAGDPLQPKRADRSIKQHPKRGTVPCTLPVGMHRTHYAAVRPTRRRRAGGGRRRIRGGCR